MFSNYAYRLHVCVLKSFSCVRLFANLWTVPHQAPLSIGLPRQEYWSGLPFPTPEDPHNPGIKSGLLCVLHWQVDSLLLTTREGHTVHTNVCVYIYIQSEQESLLCSILNIECIQVCVCVYIYIYIYIAKYRKIQSEKESLLFSILNISH